MITKTIFFEPAITHCEHNSSESGRTLEEVIRNIRHQPYEIVAIFDACGNKICEHTNHQEEYTAFAIPEQWASAASLMVHNHLVDGTFSPQDLVSNAMTNVCISIIASPSCNFYLFRPLTGWPDTIGEIAEEYDTITQLLQRNPHHDYNFETARHLALLKVTQHYGIKYRVEAINGTTLPDAFSIST